MSELRSELARQYAANVELLKAAQGASNGTRAHVAHNQAASHVSAQHAQHSYSGGGISLTQQEMFGGGGGRGGELGEGGG